MATRVWWLVLGSVLALATGCGKGSGASPATLSFQPAPALKAPTRASSPSPGAQAGHKRAMPASAVLASPAASATPAVAISASPAASAGPTPEAGMTLAGPFAPAADAALTSPVTLAIPPLAGGNWVVFTINRQLAAGEVLAYQARYPAGAYIPPLVLPAGTYTYQVVSTHDHETVATSPRMTFTVTGP